MTRARLSPISALVGRHPPGDWTYRLTDGKHWLL
jgi:hypothetical protein